MGRADMKLLIGTSGFHYKEWKGEFYPEKLSQKNWFQYYCQHFNTIELNTTFYRFPRVEFLRNWFDRSPDDFSFSVKAPRLITHFSQFKNCDRYLSDFYTAVRDGLGHKLGAVLFQFPSTIQYKKEFLDLIMENLNYDFINVLEFRDHSWWTEKVYRSLAAKGVVFCGMSHPNLPDSAIVNCPVFYYRFHGVPRLYYSEYPVKKLKAIANALKEIKSVEKAFFYFNNTAGLGALSNARWMQEYFGVAMTEQSRSRKATNNKKLK